MDEQKNTAPPAPVTSAEDKAAKQVMTLASFITAIVPLTGSNFPAACQAILWQHKI